MTITLYATTSCPFCKQVRDFLKTNKITFQEIDVASDTHQAELMIQKTGQMGVPVLVAGEEIIIGFDEEKIKKALGI